MSDSSHNSLDEITAQQRPNEGLRLPATPLAAAILGTSSIPLIEYRGTQTAQIFSSASEELTALLTDAGAYDLGWRGFLRCAGRDRVRWLNGMVTNSVKDLADNTGCYAFVLNAQGRIQGDLDIYRRSGDPDALWLQADHAQIEPLTAFVRRYIIMDQVTLKPQPEWTAIGVAGPHAANKLAVLGLPAAELSPIHLAEVSLRGVQVIVVAAYSPFVPRYEIWVESKGALDIWNALTESGAVPCGVNAIEQLRVLEGTPAYGIDIVDRDLPQETNQMRALNFSKGCYLGQEIVERIRSRGSVHRTLSGFLLESSPSSQKTPVLAADKPVGELTSVARVSIPAIGERVVALGHIRREALDSKEVLTADGIVVTPCALPFALL